LIRKAKSAPVDITDQLNLLANGKTLDTIFTEAQIALLQTVGKRLPLLSWATSAGL
jgi:hypothetical protein